MVHNTLVIEESITLILLCTWHTFFGHGEEETSIVMIGTWF